MVRYRYPLVINLTWLRETTIFNGNPHYKWWLSIAMLVITRGYLKKTIHPLVVLGAASDTLGSFWKITRSTWSCGSCGSGIGDDGDVTGSRWYPLVLSANTLRCQAWLAGKWTIEINDFLTKTSILFRDFPASHVWLPEGSYWNGMPPIKHGQRTEIVEFSQSSGDVNRLLLKPWPSRHSEFSHEQLYMIFQTYGRG